MPPIGCKNADLSLTADRVVFAAQSLY